MSTDNALEVSASAVDQLKRYSEVKDPFDYDPAAIDHLQLQAIKERFHQCMELIPIVGKQAKDQGIEDINSLHDLVPLLFSHEVYKSYPETFVRNNQWAMMNRWLDTLSSGSVGSIDVSDVDSSESWVERLAENGHHVIVSGGTSGKNSFLNRTSDDFQRAGQSIVQNVALTQRIEAGKRDRPVIMISPSQGAYVFVSLMHSLADAFGRADATYWLDETQEAQQLNDRITALRAKVANGTASPGELTELDAASKTKQEEMQKSVSSLVDALIKHKDEPVLVVGMWYPHYVLVEEARRRGLEDGFLHPESIIFTGGGTKGARMPDDYKEQIAKFYGVDTSRYYGVYGMVEMLTGMIECSAKKYHCQPWVKILILDKPGENLMPVENGRVEGRMAFFDIAVDGRWGGIITGDKVTVDYNPCSCGRKSPQVSNIMRYSDLPDGDDKLSCAGSMSSYIRGELS